MGSSLSCCALHMQFYLWPPNAPSLLSGGNRLSSLQLVCACETENIQARILTFIARGLHSLQQIMHQANTPFCCSLPTNLVFLSFSCRTRQRPTTRATNTPGSSKPWRPRRTGSDEPGKPRPQGGRETETETETGNEIGIGIGTRRPHLRQLFPHSWIQAYWREQVRSNTQKWHESIS